MENRAYAILTGLFTLLFGAALVYAFLWFRGEARPFDDYLLVSRYSVNGLYPQSEVRFRGIAVGKVETLKVDPADPRNILIAVAVDREVPITRGTYARLGYQGVTGLAYVMLDDDGANLERLKPEHGELPRIPVRPNLFDDLTSAGQAVLQQANDLLERLNRIASEENEQRLAATLKSFEEASRQLEPALRSIPQVANRVNRLLSEENTRSLQRSLSNLEQATNAIGPIADDSRKVLANIQSMSQRLDRISEEISAEISEGTLPRINTLVEELTQDSRDLRRVLLQLENDPQSVLFGRKSATPGPGEPGFSGGQR
jgi:phospholipid/cholesterol/gamma-HCH transport system substrate-binding protein